MTSNELNEILNKTRRTPNISLTTEQAEELVKDLELLEKYKRVMCKPIVEIMKELEVLDQLKEILSMDYLVRVYGYDMAKRLQTYLKSNDAVKRWLDGKDSL